MVKTADVFLMNFAPATAKRLHVAEDDIRAGKPDIVYAAVSCYGWDGPRGNYRGHEQMGQAVTGMQERWGRDLGLPVMQSMPICDLGTGNLAALATMLALFERMRGGEGQFVSASLAHTGTFHQVPFMIDYAGRVWDAPAGQHTRGTGPLYRLYRASDRWFFLAAGDIDSVRAVVGDAALEQVFASRPAEEWVERLQAAGVGAHLNCTPAEVMESGYPLIEERELPDLGRVLMFRPGPVPKPPGGDNLDLLDELGLGEAYRQFLADGVMATEVQSTLARP
jgi:crotonobetainyl-CoA:carnitine CoA-transferase CaiB-like acyl-CoA transferase